MKNKQGFLLAEETLKIILSLIAIGFLIFLLASVYLSIRGSDKAEFAEASLSRLTIAIANQEQTVEIFNPEEWFILSDEGNLCICEKNEYDSCKVQKTCEESSYVLDEPIMINPPLVLEMNHETKTISKQS